jgi:hypothetical protein
LSQKVTDYDTVIFDFERNIFKRKILHQLFLYKEWGDAAQPNRKSSQRSRIFRAIREEKLCYRPIDRLSAGISGL